MARNIAWREGLFIRPQHFQQSSRAVENEMMARTINASANSWGLFNIEIDDQLLSLGKLSLKSISGIMPDGTLFSNDDFIEKPTITINKKDSGENIYLALPLNNNEKDIYFEEQDPLPVRYFAKIKKDIANANIGEESFADITYMYPNFMLLKKSELKDGYSWIQIAKIGSISADNTISLDQSFSPTYLHLHKSEKTVSKLNELQGMLRYRAEKISEKIMGGALHSAELGDYLILQLLNRSESKLHYYITQEKIHPGDLYLALTEISAELAVFMKKEKRLSAQYTYIHEEQNLCFETLFKDLKEMLGHVLESSSTPIPLEKHKYGVRVGLIQDKTLLKNTSMILAVSSKLDNMKLTKLLMDNLKIGTVEEISNLVNHHLPGFKIEKLSSAPREIPYRVNQSYFRVILASKDVSNLMRSPGIALHYPEAEKSGIEFMLWAIKKH